MKNLITGCVIILTVAVTVFVSTTAYAGPADCLPENATVVADEVRTVEGQTFRFVRFADSEGNTGSVILNPAGKPVPESALPSARRSLIGKRLSDMLGRKPYESGYIKDDEVIKVRISLKEEAEVCNDPPEHGSAAFDEKGRVTVRINGRVADEKELEANTRKRYERIAARREARIKKRRSRLTKLADRNGLHHVPGFQKALNGGRSSLRLEMPKGQIIGFVRKNEDYIAGAELYDEPEVGLADAMTATNIDPWALNWPGYHTGSGIGIYMNDQFHCPDPGYISNYTRVEGQSADYHSELVSAVLRGVSPDSYIYCKTDCGVPDASDLNGYDGNPPIHIENYTCGGAYEDDNSYSKADKEFDNHVYNNNTSVFVLAGNNSKIVWTRARALNVITVGNYDNRNNKLHRTSSYANPETRNEKPEIVAPGTDITAGGYTDTGTSFAAPHAAAFAANILSAYKSWAQWRPALIKAHMLASATDVITGDDPEDKGTGLGGIDFLSNPWNLKAMKWWEGENNAFSYFDSVDPYPNNDCIDYKFHVTPGNQERIRIVLCWLNSGTYVYDHRHDNYPMGIDLDMEICDPYGNLIKTCANAFNPYEVADLMTPFMEGYYRIKIKRVRDGFFNKDTVSKLHIGLVVNPYNR